jgi:hypothetical protein
LTDVSENRKIWHRRLLEDVKKRYEYEKWEGITNLEEDLFIWKFFLSGKEFPNWHAHLIKPTTIRRMPPMIKTIWRPAEAEPEKLLRMDVYECKSRVAAHVFLMRLLGEFQSPLIERDMNLVGDVAFRAREEFAIQFARANIVFALASVGHNLVSVKDFAGNIDSNLISRPDVKNKVSPEITRFDIHTKKWKVGVPVPIVIEALDVLNRPLWFKFFSPGEVLLEEGQLFYRPISKGLQKVTVFAISAERNAARRELQLTVT